MSKLFTTDNISSSLSCLSLQHTNLKLTVNSWQHISIAFKHKHGQFAEDLIDLDENNSIDALQAGHSHATENQIYGLSPDALADASEDILPLFLDASKQLQLILHIIPSGHIIPYSEIHTKQFKDFTNLGKLGVKSIQTINKPSIPHAAPLSEDKIVDSIVAKLGNEIFPHIESQITAKIIAALTPTIQAVITNALKNMQIPKSGVNTLWQESNLIPTHNKKMATNEEDLDELYDDFPSNEENLYGLYNNVPVQENRPYEDSTAKINPVINAGKNSWLFILVTY